MGSRNSIMRRRSSKVFAEDQQTTPAKTMLVDEATYFEDHDSGRRKKEGLKRRANSLTPNSHSPSYTRKRSIVFAIEEKPTLPQRTIMSKSATIISPCTADNYFKSHNYSRIPSFLESEDFLFKREEASTQSQFADAENDILISKSPSVHSISSFVSCSSESESSSSCSEDTFSPSNRSSPSLVPPLKGNPFSSDNITNLNKSNFQTRRNTMKL